tara:strand:- start:688 stop:2265 length:1578 start_codon:yes stop_codon:yes gene_type:complete
LKYIISILSIVFFLFGPEQEYDYELVSVDSEKIYYTIIKDEGSLFFGTNQGVYKLEKGIRLVEYNPSIKGPITSNLKRETLRISFIRAPKNIPIGEFGSSITSIQSFKNYVYVISRGKLLIFKNKLYSFSPFESVRSITTSYTGSYNGIFKRGEVLTYPPYTNGQIKEYDDITFICYDGIVAIRGDQQDIIYDAPAGNRIYGSIENIFKLQNGNYVVVSDLGLYLYNLEENMFQMIYDGLDGPIIPLRVTFRDGFEFKPGFWFGQNNTMYKINLSTYQVSTVQTFDAKIVDMVSERDIFYILTSDQQITSLYSDNHRTFVVNKIPLAATFHTLEHQRNYLFISGNNGLSIYDLSENQLHNNVVIDEFNRGAVFKTDNSISLGGIHGIYRFENIDLLVDSISTDLVVNELDYRSDTVLVLIVILLGFVVLIYVFKSRRRIYNNQEMVLAIQKYINGNLNKVDVVAISEKFNIDNNLLYHLDADFKPGDYIKQRRKEKATELIAKGFPIEKIAKVTGYSVSYLKRYF